MLDITTYMNQTIQEVMKYLPWVSSLCPNLRVFFILSSKAIIANCIQTKSCNHIPPVSLDSCVDLGFVGISAGCLQTDRFCRTERRHQEQMSRPCHHQWPCKLPKIQSTVDNTVFIGSGSEFLLKSHWWVWCVSWHPLKNFRIWPASRLECQLLWTNLLILPRSWCGHDLKGLDVELAQAAQAVGVSHCQILSLTLRTENMSGHLKSKTWESDRQSRTEIQKNLVTSAMTFARGCLTTEWVCCLPFANSPFCARYTTVLSSDSCPRGASKTPSLDKVESLSRQAAPMMSLETNFLLEN